MTVGFLCAWSLNYDCGFCVCIVTLLWLWVLCVHGHLSITGFCVHGHVIMTVGLCVHGHLIMTVGFLCAWSFHYDCGFSVCMVT